MEQETTLSQSITAATPRIFISHSSKDDIFGTKLHADLCKIMNDEDAAWYDSRGGLKPGDIWWFKVTEELKARPIFIVILSPDSLASQWVKDEILMAWRQRSSGKQIIPLSYKACQIPDNLDWLYNIQHISFEDPAQYDKSLQTLLKVLNIPLKVPDPSKQPSSPTQPIIPEPNVSITESEIVSTATPPPFVPSFNRKARALQNNNLPHDFRIDLSPPIRLPSSLPIDDSPDTCTDFIDLSPPIRLSSSPTIANSPDTCTDFIDLSSPIRLSSSLPIDNKPDTCTNFIDLSPPIRLPSSPTNRIREDI